MEAFIDTLFSNPVYMAIAVVLAILLVYSIIKKIIKWIFLFGILLIIYAIYLNYTGQEVPKNMDELKESVSESVDKVKELCERWNEAAEVAEEFDLELGMHNHWWEFSQVEGRSAFDIMLEEMNENIFFQIDTYWVNTGGGNAESVVELLGERAPLLHIKDGPCTPDGDMVAVGEGKMEFAPIIEASHGASDWLIVELDRCATDMMEAVEKSYQYLVSQGLGRGANTAD